MSYKDFYDKLIEYRMITPIWEYELRLIYDEMNVIDKDVNNKDEYLILFSIYFSLIGKGNVCMSLKKGVLLDKWNLELSDAMALAINPDKVPETEKEKIEKDFCEIKKISEDAFEYLDKIKGLHIVSSDKIFEIEDNYLYLRKYNYARNGIKESIKRLYDGSNPKQEVDFKKIYNLEGKFQGLSAKQEDVVKYGINNNLVITGGPGTGKTTAILFILYFLLSKAYEAGEPYPNIYLAAASGKASSRMKESIINGLRNIKETAETKPIIDKIKGVIKDDTGQEIEEFTIHRLLGVDFETGGFKYNKNNQFSNNSIFVIDEASMIDICLFNSLLEAIPTGARIFILGDKDQLPSVEVGAVFGDLVEWNLNNNVIRLDVSIRFTDKTEIYKLAQVVNNGGALPAIKFDNISSFEIKELDKKNCPVYYYENNNCKEQKKNIEFVVKEWAKNFYSNVQKDCTKIYLDKDSLDKVFNYTEEAKILCAENDGIRGVRALNKFIKKCVIKSFLNNENAVSLSNQFPGQVMMINKNNKALNLYNGDTGILVTVNEKDDDTIYFMVKKVMKRISQDGYKKDEMFKIGAYVFYPFRLITLSDIDLAYAITVHKSQGSDYNSILVILPTTNGHPLLNRQIVYTAITRTKGNTYILSNTDNLEKAKDRLLIRDTNICKKVS